MEQTIINQVATISLLMLVGVLARKLKILSPPTVKGLSNLLVNLVLPSQIIVSFILEFSPEMLLNASLVLAMAVAIHLLAILLGELLFRSYPPSTRAVLRFATVFSNCAYMGFPVLDGIYGTIGVFYGSFYNMAFILFVWTRGLSYFNGRGKGTKITGLLLNPGLVAIAIGLLLFVSPFDFPPPVIQTLEIVGSMTTPLSMLIIGSTLAGIKLSSLFTEASTYYVSLVRLLLMPLLVVTGLYFLRLPSLPAQVLILQTAMPAAALTAVFAEKYNGDTLLASKTVFLSTVFSLVTIPLIVVLLRYLGLAI
mgnify:CR=1 FL=1